MSTHPALPSSAICEQARLSRDARFDGLFFTAVRSTGIYCRPVCPAPAPKPENVGYYASAAAAEAAGFRPCLRCRPELSPEAGSWRRGDAVLARALQLIDEGALDAAPLSRLAERLHLGERQLRRVFSDRLGAAPSEVQATRRLLFAKQLLTETRLAVTEVALASGFASLRRFNAAFVEAYGMPPTALRKTSSEQGPGQDALVLRLNYRPPYDFDSLLGFLRGRALPGLECVDAHSYARVVGSADSVGWLRVSAWPQARGEPAHALRLELHGVPASALQGCVRRVRRMFDLDAEPAAIAEVLGRDARLAPLVLARPGLRLPVGFDGFEIAVRAVIGQQVSVAAARTVTARLAERFGGRVPPALQALGFAQAFPTPADLVEADLQPLGLTRARAETLRSVARALLEGHVEFAGSATLAEFLERWTALPGIGPWTANYLALRALGHPDAFPAEDLVLQRALPKDGSRLSAAALRARAESWRPWRSYAVLHLWRDAMPAVPSAAAPARTATTAAASPGTSTKTDASSNASRRAAAAHPASRSIASTVPARRPRSAPKGPRL